MKLSKILVAAVAVMFGVGSFAMGAIAEDEAESLSARQTIVNTTDRVMKIINDAQSYYDQEPERFYLEIGGVLDDVVDFNSFAYGVMGAYASKKAYMALSSDEEKAAFKERMTRFSTTFRDGLVQTYAKGLLAFDGNKIDVLELSADAVAGGSVTVIQHIYGEAEKPYVVHYKMKQNGEGDWKLRNVTIEAINLGKIYQSQFASSAKLYDQDIDRVIDNWSVDPSAD